MEIPPILFIVFNRPDKTAEVFDAIRSARPSRLFVVADGPRADREDDAWRCSEVRRLIENGVDWDCELKTLFRPENLGCKLSVSQGITWFFDQVEEGIIMEDDVLPSRCFFAYCAELLERYRNDERVLLISGNNFQYGRKRGCASYYASRYTHIWGWATWRRAWAHYDVEIASYEGRWDAISAEWNLSADESRLWKEAFDCVKANGVDTWDYQLLYMALNRHGISLHPNCNLVSNIGFGTDASHTIHESSPLNRLPRDEYDLITHPKTLQIDPQADEFTLTHVFLGKPMGKLTLSERAKNWCWRMRNSKSRFWRRLGPHLPETKLLY